MIVRAIFSLIIVIVFSLFAAPAVSAHSTEPRIEISLERLRPGEVVDVRGVNFGMDETIALALLGTDMEILLGDVTSDAEGGFTHIVVLPTVLAEGSYYFRATTSHHWVLSPPFTVWGTSHEEGGGQGLRDEDDGLLAPMPTIAPVVATLPLVEAPVAAGPAVNWSYGIVAAVGLIILAAAVVLRFKQKS